MSNKRISGYEAADIIIQELLDDAKKKLEPYAKREGRKIDWWKGYNEGLLAAHCFMVLGQFPDHHENPKQLEDVIDREKKRRDALMK
jgi:hypothetical protein